MYRIKRTHTAPALDCEWNAPGWDQANVLEIACVRPESSDHHPKVECKLLHDGQNIYGMYRVEDRYVRCVAENYNDSVCTDSCVEFFVEPPGGKGYLNFEFSGNGALLLYHVRDARRMPGGFADFNPVSEADAAGVQIASTLPARVEPEIAEPLTWLLAFKAPAALFAKQMQAEYGDLSGQQWRANFYKCGDNTSHPHWISWLPVSELNFHLPQCFGPIYFE
jgi:hypothetical protein